MTDVSTQVREVQGPHTTLALHTLGWKAFQDLCAQVCAEVLGTTVSVYREAQDGGQDAVFLISKSPEEGTEEATVQCKFSSKADQRLRPSDVRSELETVRRLVRDGRASTYYFVTSLGVDAPVAAAVRDQLKAVGVLSPHVFGKEWLTLQIRGNSRLRALVPRVYGLGDLSLILDERCARQTQALLGHMMDGLRVYVPTAAHRNAVRVLSEHNLVLLLGPPATGKTMLAAILATAAMDGENHQCMKCEGPLDLVARWNPDERNRLYWIDDAFGPNQLRSDYIDTWISIIPKVKTAIDAGNRFILTSRIHIWNAAKHKLGTRNHPLLTNGAAVVNVGLLSPEERQQIIYNHLKAGNQSKPWRRQVKPHLADVADSQLLLPEIARRLGDRNFTKAIRKLPSDLMKFVSEPAEFLKDTIQELTDAQQAALTLVFLWRSRLPVSEITSSETRSIADKYGIPVATIVESLPQLDGSFVTRRREDEQDYWGFYHPTFADAITEILGSRPDLVELYIRGTRVETLLSETICDGATHIPDAVVIPSVATEHLVTRLLDIPNTPELNRSFFGYLESRASETVLKTIISRDPAVLSRQSIRSWRIGLDSRIKVIARAHRLGMLNAEIRMDAAYELEASALNGFDASFLDDDEVLGLIPPSRVIRLTVQLLEQIEEAVPDRIAELAREVDPDSDVSDYFDDIRMYVEQLQNVFYSSSGIQDQLSALDKRIVDTVAEVSLRKKRDDEQGDWSNVSPARVTTALHGRSIFSDIDD
ncbi:restriction endonuclease [Cupriavidus basilensis]|uniref:Uncharacterized protein y4cD n=1 Tax=Cupriavidus basilensis TaxID=68895 RepID=A0A0C4YHY8_9BURK|nr:restriction endonuclease [Cupriavidus basilensis]AJG22220.1 Uncharacterized protein y4cD [Cupriavidus basilensis]